MIIADVWQKNPLKSCRTMAARSPAGLCSTILAAMLGRLCQRRFDKDLPFAKGVAQLAVEQFDSQFGGFSYSEANPRRPKFPEPSNLLLLLERSDSSDAATARKMLTVTLDHMARGGIRDHLGGGFHRYSTDHYWARGPISKRCCTDNAQFAGDQYATAYKLTGNTDYRRVADEMLSFVSRELTAPDGGFYSSLDAVEKPDGDEGQSLSSGHATRCSKVPGRRGYRTACSGSPTARPAEPNFEGALRDRDRAASASEAARR